MGGSIIGKMKTLRDVNWWWKKTEVATNLEAELVKADVEKNDLDGSVSRSGQESGARHAVGGTLACRIFDVSDTLSVQPAVERRERRDCQSAGPWTSWRVTIRDGQALWLLNVLDDFSHDGLGILVDFSVPAKRVISSLNRIIQWHGKPGSTPLKFEGLPLMYELTDHLPVNCSEVPRSCLWKAFLTTLISEVPLGSRHHFFASPPMELLNKSGSLKILLYPLLPPEPPVFKEPLSSFLTLFCNNFS